MEDNVRWFKPLGPIFLPVSAAGWLITLAAAAFAINVFMVADGHSHSVSDTLYAVFPYWAPIFLLWLWVAQKSSPPAAEKS
jgi:hypothetical protein